MWFILITVILAPVNGEFGRDAVSTCETDPDIICHTPRFSADNVPSDDDEMGILCPRVIRNLECLHDYDLACNGRSDYVALPDPLDYDRMKEFLDEACRERTHMHRVLVRRLPCIKSRVTGRDYICSKSRNKILEAYEEYYNTHSAYRRRVRGSEEKEERIDCLSSMYTTGCVLNDIEENCGFSAYDIGETLISTNILADICGPDVFQEIAEIIDDMDIKIKYKDILNKLFVIYLE